MSELKTSAKFKVTVTTANNEHDVFACHNWTFNKEGAVLLLEDENMKVKYLVPLFNVRNVEFKPITWE